MNTRRAEGVWVGGAASHKEQVGLEEEAARANFPVVGVAKKFEDTNV